MSVAASRSASPREEGELEDGEISDDSVRPDSPQHFRHRPSSRGPLNPHYRSRQQRPPYGYPHRPPPRVPPQPPPPSRPSFWERSHDTLGRFRSRGRGGRFWDREREERVTKPGGQRPNSWRAPSPRKLKSVVRSPPRKSSHSSKSQNCEEESFEDLLLKYKQIKLELESINKDEKLALKEQHSKEQHGKEQHQQQRGKEQQQQRGKEQHQQKRGKEQHQHGKEQHQQQHQHGKEQQQQHSKEQLQQQHGKAQPPQLDEEQQQQHDEEPQPGKEQQQHGNEQQQHSKEQEEHTGENAVEFPVKQEDLTTDAVIVEDAVEEKPQVKTFQAFELKPLRQKLKIFTEKQESIKEEPSSAVITNDTETHEDDMDTVDLSVILENATDIKKQQEEGFLTLQTSVKEEEELSELHLRLLALQSASKKWQQKEQIVMKEGKEKLSKGKTEPQKEKEKTEQQKENSKIEPQCEKGSSNSTTTRKVNSAANAAKQALRRQQTKAWKKLQQQKAEEKRREEEEKKKRAEEEEKRKREEEIRKIRDLSNQEEQYNRFMKLVGDKSKRSKSFDTDQKRSDKLSVDSSGCVYQYDNYEEVAMDTDSETNSPGASPSRLPYSASSLVGDVPSALCVTDQYPSVIWPPHYDVSVFSSFLSGATSEISLPPPPLPPEEPEQPPKPPFADEEEEEEMLLREELLKSLANKRAVRPEKPSKNSQPQSPPIANNILPVPRIMLTATGNASTHRKNNTQIIRVLRPIRRVIKLPKHKSVVVTLNASDSDESDPEPPSPGLSVFGGLESMIKEARRTAEASKPKPPPKSEKENDPLRTPETLPDDKKFEYRLLREEISSREKQKLLKMDQIVTSLSPANSDIEVDGCQKPAKDPKVTDAESRHTKTKMLLVKDESLLKNLLQQEEKKKESIKTAEMKMTKLTEQLQATEKFLNASRAFLKKLQEQIVKVQLRVQEKRSLTVKSGEDLARAKALVSQELRKRKLEPRNVGANKMFKSSLALDSPRKQSAESIALEKKRLQELEKEYALKIQKLKEMQVKKIKEQIIHNPPVIEEQPEFVLPQPSLHDLSQDKITLDTEEVEPEDEDVSTSVKERRRSFRDSNSFTKPNFKHTELTPYKDSNSKLSRTPTEGPELFMGLNIDELRSLQSSSSELLTELLSNGQSLLVSQHKLSTGKVIPVDVDLIATQTKQGEVKPFSFEAYHSPLLVFKSYRFSPYFRTKEKLLLSSVSHSNMIEPKTFFCRFDLTGTCNDDDCQWQHMRDCTLSRKQLFQDILSYDLDLIGCSEKSSDEEIVAATEKYVDKLFGVNRDRMSMDLMSVLLVSHVNESRNHVPPHTTYKEKRKWKPMYWKRPISDCSSSDEEETTKASICVAANPPELKTKVPIHDGVVTTDDVRYYTSETDDISNLEASVLDNPQDIQLWIKLAYKCLNQNEGTSSERLDASLNVLSRALEHNRDNQEIWGHYLKLFSKRGTSEEIQEMCETAVEYASSFQIWWSFLTLENSFDGKDQVCSRALQYLMKGIQEDQKSELLSLQCLEILLYRVHLNLFTGRLQNANAILQNALKSPCERSVADYLTPQDRCLAWLSYIHLMEYNTLPANFYDPANANPARIVNKEPFRMPWMDSQSVKTDPAMLLALFEAAVFTCSDEALNAKERIEVCLPLYKHMIVINLMLNRPSAAVDMCKQLLSDWSDNCDILEALSSVYLTIGQPDDGFEVWINAFRNNPGNAHIFYNVCRYLAQQGLFDKIPVVMEEFIRALFESIDDQCCPADLLRYLLKLSVPLDFKAPVCKVEGCVDDLQISYLWLAFCLWQSFHASAAEAVNAFEAALGAVMQQNMLQKLWMDYLVFTNSKLMGSRNKLQDSKHFTDLVNRCLMTVPSRHPTPFSTADYWTNYEFHNSVVYFYLSCVPKTQHSKILERFSSMMPANLGLALRVLKQELEDNNMQTVKMLSKMFTYNFPMCLPIWKIAIAAETFLKGQKEVHRLYERALQKFPLCAELWKDHLLFEASGGGKTDNLRKLVSKCQEVGVSLDELLNFKTESKNF